MTAYQAPLEDVHFLMKDVFKVDQLWAELSGHDELDVDTADAILEGAAKICEQVIAPLNRPSDEQGVVWVDGKIVAADGYKEAYQTFCEGGWNALEGNSEYGAMGMPKTLVAPIDEFVRGSCMSFGLLPMLTIGASVAIDKHGSEPIKERYLPKMYSGEWTGAMDLTEPHCGTDLGLIRTKAVPEADGSYRLSGTKIFITWGEHELSDNIIHLVLAKLPGAPAGTRGISLFLVPKYIVNDDGALGDRNSVSCGSIEHKMGIKASATCVMNFDAASAWLIGEENKGLACMFTMMNNERLAVGVQGLGVAELAYQQALAYAKDRLQGRSPTGAKNKDQEADSLLVHPDIRRILLKMKALNEGGRAFYLYVARLLDIEGFSSDPAKQREASSLVALLTPVVKAFVTDMAFDTAVDGQQVLGGHGFIREWGLEQHVRDIRITQIYEGTNGIQAMDLIARKVIPDKGAVLSVYLAEISAFIDEVEGHARLSFCLPALRQLVVMVKEVTDALISASAGDANAPGAAAVDYLHLLGYLSYAYMWAIITASLAVSGRDDVLAQAKWHTAKFFFSKLLPKTHALKESILAGSDSLMALGDEHF
ncbi:MAG: acyl-CoA dehydrogenase [Alteromonadaceae bacterium]|nr:MAG: acyl-CoA dehydrogenase [Alteromonadaceae bacterium]